MASALSINGKDIPHQGVRLVIDSAAYAIEGSIRVLYVVSLQDHNVETVEATGLTIPAALRALADAIEAR